MYSTLKRLDSQDAFKQTTNRAWQVLSQVNCGPVLLWREHKAGDHMMVCGFRMDS